MEKIINEKKKIEKNNERTTDRSIRNDRRGVKTFCDLMLYIFDDRVIRFTSRLSIIETMRINSVFIVYVINVTIDDEKYWLHIV